MEPPRAAFAHVGGSGTWAFPYPDDALAGHPTLSVRVIEPDIRVDRVTPPFGWQGSQTNLSIRGNAGSGNETLIGRFTVDATARQVLIRGVGPRLADLGLTAPDCRAPARNLPPYIKGGVRAGV